MRLHLALAAAVLGVGACSSNSGGGGTPTNAFAKCAPCHNADPGGPNGLGPNLHGVVGRKAASLADFNYSPAMRASGLTWDEATLDRFLADPKKAVPGTKMTFSGLRNPAQRHDVIAFLSRQSGPHQH